MLVGKIAFLFLTIGDVYHAAYWQDFFRGHENQYSVYAHSKEKLSPSDWLFPYEIPEKIPTTWANTMQAQVALLKYALKDLTNKKFIFVSDSTIPLKGFDAIYKAIMHDDKSIIKYWKNPYVGQSIGRDLFPIPPSKQYKNPQWVIINRKHATAMVTDHYYLPLITSYTADNEMYPATFLLNIGEQAFIEPRETTYTVWPDEFGNVDHPRTFKNFKNPLDMDPIKDAIKQDFLFVRKIAKNCLRMHKLDRLLLYRKHKRN